MHPPGSHTNLKLSQGFTLIELSVVLVIIGLIAGGAVAGQSIIRTSKINSVMTDVNSYIAATNSFQQKYNSLPGDFANATGFWGAAAGSTSDNYTITCYGTGNPNSTATCNGDGNGQISPWNNVVTNTWNEEVLYWKHLSNAQMIPGTYTGVLGSVSTADNVPGINCPMSKVDGAGYGINYTGSFDIGSNASWFGAKYNHAIFFGIRNPGSTPLLPALSPKEALSFDLKFDDGSPATGFILTQTSSSTKTPNCVTSTSVTSTYNTALLGPQCSFIFITGF